TPGHTDRILAVIRDETAVQLKLGQLFDTVELDSPRATEMRERHNRNRQMAPSRPEKSVTHPPMRQMIAAWLDRFEAGDLDAWWRLNLDLTLKPDSDYYQTHLELYSDL